MTTRRIIADKFATAATDNPECTALVVGSESDTLEILMQTMQVPLAAASLLKASQEGVLRMTPDKVAQELEWNLESSQQLMPDAVDISLLAGGNVLCINVGTGVLLMKLTPRAKEALKKL